MDILSREEERRYARDLAACTKISFEGKKLKLGIWGEADDFAKVRDNFYVLFELEIGQKHPNTNVLKVWPYLEENPQISIVLVQLFKSGARNEKGNRGQLAQWTADKMSSQLGPRFNYVKILIHPDDSLSGDFNGLQTFVFPD